ncbi:hypothetical protein TNCV_3251611 [Trichonephila clavipes]|nr:hypothetical protein TNCV_3251611 [Trichonephila clavipes]
MTAIEEGPRKFEPLLNDEDDTLASTLSPNLHVASNEEPTAFINTSLFIDRLLVTDNFCRQPLSTDKRCRQSGIHRVQCIGTGGRHPFWHGCSAGRPRHQPGQASAGMLP